MIYRLLIYTAFFVFSVGVFGILTRRNAIGILISIELMLNSANLILVTFSSLRNSLKGEAFVFFTMAITVVEVAVGLAIVVLIFRLKKTANADEIDLLKG